MKKLKSAFTLIEILVVVTIIALILGISLFGLQNARAQSRDAKRKADLESIRSALELYKADNGYYPDRVEEISPCGGGWECSIGTHWINILTPTYMGKMPIDPINNSTYWYKYAVCKSGSRIAGVGMRDYKLMTKLETETNPTEDCSWCDGTTGGSGSLYCVTSP